MKAGDRVRLTCDVHGTSGSPGLRKGAKGTIERVVRAGRMDYYHVQFDGREGTLGTFGDIEPIPNQEQADEHLLVATW